MYRLLISLSALLFINTASSQNLVFQDRSGGLLTSISYAQKYGTPDSSPYLDLEFKPAKISEREKAFMVRFNAYEGLVEVRQNEDQVIELSNSDSERIKMLDGSNRIYHITDYRNSKGEMEQGFLEEIAFSEGNALYMKEVVRYIRAKKPEGFTPAQQAKFEKSKPQFYFKPAGENEVIVYLSPNKKKFLDVFDSESAAKAKAIIKKERLNLTKSEDVIQIFNSIYIP